MNAGDDAGAHYGSLYTLFPREVAAALAATQGREPAFTAIHVAVEWVLGHACTRAETICRPRPPRFFPRAPVPMAAPSPQPTEYPGGYAALAVALLARLRDTPAQTPAELIVHVGARRIAVRRVLAKLLRAGKVTATGNSRARRYSAATSTGQA